MFDNVNAQSKINSILARQEESLLMKTMVVVGTGVTFALMFFMAV